MPCSDSPVGRSRQRSPTGRDIYTSWGSASVLHAGALACAGWVSSAPLEAWQDDMATARWARAHGVRRALHFVCQPRACECKMENGAAHCVSVGLALPADWGRLAGAGLLTEELMETFHFGEKIANDWLFLLLGPSCAHASEGSRQAARSLPCIYEECP